MKIVDGPGLRFDRRIFLLFALAFLVCLPLAIYREQIFFLGLPFGIMVVQVLVTDYRWLYYLLLFCLPFSLEIGLPGGFSLFLPTEPLVVVLALAVLVSWRQIFPARLWPPAAHRFRLLLFLFFGWALYTTLFSVDPLKSIKYLVAQGLYLLVFFGLTFSLLHNPRDIARLWRIYGAGLVLVLAIILIRHANMGLSFAQVNHAVAPFFLNHVVYAVTAGLSLPLVVYLAWHHRQNRQKWIWLGCAAVVLLAIIFSYTRATWLALPALGIYYFLLHKRWLLPFLLGLYLAIGISFIYLQQQNRYLAYAPEYEKTIFNKGNLGKHLQATYKLEDVSGMERLYRWIAAIRLAADKPWTGSGPATFYPAYKKYTVKSFETYVSDNPEKSTTHNYFLLQLAEQGIIGGLILVLFITYILLWPQQLYHHSPAGETRALILAAGGCLFVIIFHLLLNELLGLDKIGAFFFLSLAVLLRVDLKVVSGKW